MGVLYKKNIKTNQDPMKIWNNKYFTYHGFGSRYLTRLTQAFVLEGTYDIKLTSFSILSHITASFPSFSRIWYIREDFSWQFVACFEYQITIFNFNQDTVQKMSLCGHTIKVNYTILSLTRVYLDQCCKKFKAELKRFIYARQDEAISLKTVWGISLNNKEKTHKIYELLGFRSLKNLLDFI